MTTAWIFTIICAALSIGLSITTIIQTKKADKLWWERYGKDWEEYQNQEAELGKRKTN